MARDSQRSKVYAAERAAFPQRNENLTTAEAQAIIDKWSSSAYLRKRYPRAAYPLEVRDGRGRRNAAYLGHYSPSENGYLSHGRYAIAIPKWGRSKWVLAHEFAHHLVGMRDGAWHDWKFVEAYLYVVRVFLGKGTEETLKAEMKARRVKWRKPVKRQMTDEQRQAARERMLAMHATGALSKKNGPDA
jgi:putative metallohydrolase (TIGR04338 family)